MRAGLGSVVLSVAALTLTARILGFGRSVVFSKTIGDTCLGDAYTAANTVPNVLFEVVAGGVLAGVVIPVVARHVGGDRPAAAGRTASALLTWTLLVLTPAALVAWAAAQVYGEAFAGVGCAGSAETLAALLVMFVPQIWLYGLAVVSAGVLQAHHQFLLAAAAPLLSSLVVLGAYLGFAVVAPPTPPGSTVTTETALAVLGWGTTAGVAVLALTTAVPLARLGLRLRPRLRFAPGDRDVVLRIAAAGIAGLVLQQLATLLITWVARDSGDVGGLTRFGYANSLYLLPYAVLAAPLLQLMFPRLTTAAEEGSDHVVGVLSDLAPMVVILGWLGAALLAATAVPVARVFVLGPGSGRTDALSWPIVAFSLAVVGNTLLGLSSRTLARPAPGPGRRCGHGERLGDRDREHPGAASPGRPDVDRHRAGRERVGGPARRRRGRLDPGSSLAARERGGRAGADHAVRSRGRRPGVRCGGGARALVRRRRAAVGGGGSVAGGPGVHAGVPGRAAAGRPGAPDPAAQQLRRPRRTSVEELA